MKFSTKYFWLRPKRRNFFLIFFLIYFTTACALQKKQEKTEPSYLSYSLQHHCQEMIGPPRIEQISAHVWLAIGYDLANTVLIHTPEGNVVVDPGMCPKRSQIVKKAFASHAPPGPIKAIVYTHSHIDHTGGASVWAEKDIQIWATEAFREHFFKQYSLFLQAEMMRGRRQFGYHVPEFDLPCSAIGARPKMDAALENGTLLPTHTFTGFHRLKIGNLTLELREAHGETHDHLFIWIPEDKTLIAGDNFYWAFPNLYSIRGTSPRLIDDWIKSIDAMRRYEPEHLVSTHTKPLRGKENISIALTNYRDAIQWLRDEVVRRANKGEDLETIVENVRLPHHLAVNPYLQEVYGQIDWSVRAIYTNYLGWFDGRADQLYPLSAAEIAREEVRQLGGAERVWELAEQSWQKKEFQWAIHWLNKLQKSGSLTVDEEGLWKGRLAACYEKLAAQIKNTNGRGYLLETAYELKHGISEPLLPKLNERLIDKIPLELIFQHMAVRLDPRKTKEVHESVQFVFPDENRRFIITVRHGIAEIAQERPFPGTPEPLAIVHMEGKTYRRLAMKLLTLFSAYIDGKIKIEGQWLKFLRFMSYFQR